MPTKTMVIESQTIKVRTRHEGEMIDITDQVKNVLGKSKLNDGIVVLFVPGSTAGITTIEYEPGLLTDFPATLDRLIPKNASYEHEERWHDGNGHSHVRAALLGPDLTVPFKGQKLLLGTWQQIVFIELDVRPRDRTIIAQLIGE